MLFAEQNITFEEKGVIMKKLYYFILLLTISLAGCGDEGNPVEPKNVEWGWVPLYSQTIQDSIYCKDNITGYVSKDLTLSSYLQSNDTIRITFYYQFKGNSQNTLKMKYDIRFFDWDLFSINLTENDWHYYRFQTVAGSYVYNVIRLKFYLYLVNGNTVNLKDINVYVKK